ncbi:hypothetical protein AB0230_05125 [Microbacterium sp. NPDC089190]|uniref:hypothetical protein n=1 Tax=Microbacterium sp. NPDC089190 TaxID=3155063 RepID=UPI00344B6D39
MTTAAPSTDRIDFVHIAHDADTEYPSVILILDTEENVAAELSPDLARDLARKLTQLADDFDNYKPLRRPFAVEDQLRGLND